MSKPLNILYIHSHDTGRYISPYGHKVETPNLQRLAEEGVLFRQAFCGNPTCSASRSVLLTGMYAHSNGMLGLAHRGFAMNDYNQHLVRLLKKHGYATALSGVQHEAHDEAGDDSNADGGRHHGKDGSRTAGRKAWEIIGYDQYLAEPAKAHLGAADFLAKRTQGDKPFFLAVGFFETHREFPVEHPAVDARYVAPPAPLPDTSAVREDMARYLEMARTYDQKVGHVLNALDKAGLRESTLVISTTDHGIAFPAMKCNLTDAGIGIMLIMRGPRGFTGGKVIDSMVSHVDVAPTLFEVLGFPREAQFQGVSFLPQVQDAAAGGSPSTSTGTAGTGAASGTQGAVPKTPGAPRTALFAEVNYHASEEPMRCVRTDRYKYIRRYPIHTDAAKDTPVLANCDDSFSKDCWLDAGWEHFRRGREELYDLILDPNERNNLAESTAHGEVRADLRRRLDAWMAETSDPLADRHLPLPEKAIVNAPNARSPKERPQR